MSDAPNTAERILTKLLTTDYSSWLGGRPENRGALVVDSCVVLNEDEMALVERIWAEGGNPFEPEG